MKTTKETREKLYQATVKFRRVLFKPLEEPINKLIGILNRIIKAFN